MSGVAQNVTLKIEPINVILVLNKELFQPFLQLVGNVPDLRGTLLPSLSQSLYPEMKNAQNIKTTKMEDDQNGRQPKRMTN